MFTIDTDIKDLNVKERNITKAFFSMNNHQVATPEMMSEEARSYVIFFSEADGKISAFIGIHLLLTGRKLFYSHTSNPFPERNLGSVEEEARVFAEGLGAMLDEVNLSTMSRDEKERWIDRQDIFAPDREKSVIPAPLEDTVSVAEIPSVTQQEPQSPPAPPPQDMRHPPQTQHVPTAPVMPQSPLVQQVRQQPAQHNLPEPISEPDETPAPAPQMKSRKQQAERDAPVSQAEEEESRAFSEKPSVKAAQAPTVSKGRREIIREAINAGIVKAQKPKTKKDVQPATGVVSRDREALARLLASF